ncbi:FAD-binding oxidoreductase [Alicyclobacillus herbarius]|uniref:FAD-binding oxidoreductase n=1 Tax=Alicyclobacillus herbarius TaxID=122960 RepID=UPI00040998B5|nr:FAD-binding oxidoreductase [Alicyclobacillus herbarius]
MCIATAVSEVIGQQHVRVDDTLARRLTDQTTPVVIAAPPDESTVAQLLQMATDEDWSVVPIGAGTHLDCGAVPSRVEILLESTQLCQIVDYSPADMVVTVQSGTPLSRLQAHLANHGQMLPIDPPCSPRATIGGVVSAGLSGPHRILYGTLRDLLIGARVVLADGRVVRLGGKVVKNVAGYDVTKLLVGSRGSLGFISECTFKLKPLPLHRAMCLLRGSMYQVDRARARVMDSPLLPSACEAIHTAETHEGTPDGEGGDWWLAVDCHENREAAEFQTEQLLLLAADLGMQAKVFSSNEVEQFWVEHGERWANPECVLRVQCPPSDLMFILQEWAQVLTRQNLPPYLTASLPVGVGRVRVRTEKTENIILLLEELRAAARKRNAATVLETAPTAIRRAFPVFDSPRLGLAERRLQAAVRQVFQAEGAQFPDPYAGGMSS